MFDCKQTLTEHLTDAVDLLVDFATLGEYGLEPVGRVRPGCVDRRDCAAGCRSQPHELRESFSEALFPNRHRGPARARLASQAYSVEVATSEKTHRGPARTAKRKPAATYSPRGFPPKYHRR